MASWAMVSIPDFDLPGFDIVLTAWLAAVGQHVLPGDPIAEVAVADAVVVIAAVEEGRLLEQLVSEGERVSVGQQIARIRLACSCDGV